MISHKYKCIFIHIPKCAGSSIEKAFDCLPPDFLQPPNYDNLSGWCPKNKLYLQHATPQQLIDLNYISKEHWDSYYKFVVYRNSYARALSDYQYILKMAMVEGSFKNYITKKGAFEKVLQILDPHYCGDHLTSQKDYFFLDGKEVQYNAVINFDRLNEGLKKVAAELYLGEDFFSEKINASKKIFNHYSQFYNSRRKKMLYKLYKEDIVFFDFNYIEKKNMNDYFLSLFNSFFLVFLKSNGVKTIFSLRFLKTVRRYVNR